MYMLINPLFIYILTSLYEEIWQVDELLENIHADGVKMDKGIN